MEPAYSFGPYLLDPQTRSLRRGGVLIRLTTKVFDTLLVLVRNDGRLVEKEEIVREVWPDTVVDENNLSVTIHKLRAALGETAREWRYIETVARRGYRFTPCVRRQHRSTEHVAAFQTSRNPPPPRIAVLPLQSTNDDDFIAEGVTDALITALGRFRALRLVSYQSVKRFKNSDLPLGDIAERLSADFVVEGSVHRIGREINAALRLVAAAEDEVAWGETYGGTVPFVFRAVNDAAVAITRQIAPPTGDDGSTRGTWKQMDADALEFYLRGRYFVHRNTEEAIRQAQRYFADALTRDPEYAAARVGQAYSTFLLGLFGAIPWMDAGRQATRMAESALDADPDLADAHVVVGLVREFFAWDWSGAEEAFRRASLLSPGNVHAYYELGGLLARTGRLDESLAQVNHALNLDPVSLPSLYALAEVYYYEQEYDAAIAQARKALELAPGAAWPLTIMGLSCLQIEAFAEGMEAFGAIPNASEYPFAYGSLGYGHAVSGRRTDAQAVLRQLEEQADSGRDVAVFAGLIHAGTGEIARAVEWFARALADRSCWITWLRTDPRLHSMHSNPEFAEILREAGLEGR